MGTAVKLVEPSENEFLASLEARAKQANPFFRAMANKPEVLRNFPALYGAIVGPGALSRRVKELLYVTASYANKCSFCLASHLPGARKSGVTEDELGALQSENNAPFPVEEQAAIAYARELTRTANAETTRQELRKFYTDEQIVEMTLVVGMANLTNRFNNGLSILPE